MTDLAIAEQAIDSTDAILTDCANPAGEPDAPKPWILVTHQRPDTDAWVNLWAASRFVVPANAERRLVFIPAGTRLDPEEEIGYEVLYMDVGRGECDQHGKYLDRASSFQLLAAKYGLGQSRLLADLIELTRATDNVERISPTSIHYIFKGLPYAFKAEGSSEIDWNACASQVFLMLDTLYDHSPAARSENHHIPTTPEWISLWIADRFHGTVTPHREIAPIIDLVRAYQSCAMIDTLSIHYVFDGLPAYFRKEGTLTAGYEETRDQVFMMLDIVHSQHRQKLQSALDYRKIGREYLLENGVGIATIWWHARLREAAYDAGADVVMFTTKRKKGVEFGIQVHRDSPVTLESCMAAIRHAEAEARGTSMSAEDAISTDTLESMPTWFLHESRKLILSGSHSRHLQGDEFSRLSPERVFAILKEELGKIPRFGC